MSNINSQTRNLSHDHQQNLLLGRIITNVVSPTPLLPPFLHLTTAIPNPHPRKS